MGMMGGKEWPESKSCCMHNVYITYPMIRRTERQTPVENYTIDPKDEERIPISLPAWHPMPTTGGLSNRREQKICLASQWD